VRILDADKREPGFSIDLYDVDFLDHADASRTDPLCRS
jgi:hypothetical protein